MVAHAEFSFDEFGDAGGGPEVGAEAVVGGLLREPSSDFGVLVGPQKARPSRRGLGGQSRLAIGSMAGHPLDERSRVDAESLGDRDLSLASHNQGDGTPPQRFQFGSRSFASHPAAIIRSTAAFKSFTYLRISKCWQGSE